MDSAPGVNTISGEDGIVAGAPKPPPPPDFVFGSFPPKAVEPANLLSHAPGENDQDHGLREVVRFFQCCKCSRLFRSPVTLGCGHPFCRNCLELEEDGTPLENESPQDTAEVPCPLCGRRTPLCLIRPDVSFTKIMYLVRDVLAAAIRQSPQTPIALKEEAMDGGPPAIASDRFTYPHGGRLLATFAMADKGLLRYPATVIYEDHPRADNDRLDAALLGQLRLALRPELDCPICQSILLKPTTLSCGHTFCRHCIFRASDNTGSCRCPVCREPIRFVNKYKGLPTNEWLVSLVDSLYSEEIFEWGCTVREDEQPGTTHMPMPLFICAALFPGLRCTFQVFEEQYRLMIRRCIQHGDRTFGVVMRNMDKAPQGPLGITDFMEYGTMMQIVAWEYKPDGRSLIQARGLHRFRIVQHGVHDGYRVADVVRVDDLSLDEEIRAERREMAIARHLRSRVPDNADEPLPLPRQPSRSTWPYPPELNSLNMFEVHDRVLALVNQLLSTINDAKSERTRRLYGECLGNPYWAAMACGMPSELRYEMLVTLSERERLKMAYGYVVGLLGRIKGDG
ncbi:uncharacterized protein EI97DRAFT_390227 [Westerdykella ornata]|uniref:ATP-dependent protease-like protein n=1 Tax=Westerdykella ornata TaxID=318751 RepID=A0A6A6JY22_WESOR|nr:uncharacterized protein EI97DRAFT_390227 [Westerdykella ornata]KAF2281502.1 hypothetical protein EI97DRAFT_390227 [Westerdykella ornata]